MGGYGSSLTVPAPAWQFYNTGSMRMVPDVSADADPNTGIVVCLGTAAGSSAPNCTVTFGGTSMATPIWAGTWAIVSQAAVGISAGWGNLYYMAQIPYLTIPNTSCTYIFNSPACMMGPNNDFTHLGLGSPNISNLVSFLSGAPYITSITPTSGSNSGGTMVSATGFFPSGTGTIFFIQLLTGWVKATATSCASMQTCIFSTPPNSAGQTGGTFPVAASYPYFGATTPFHDIASYSSSEAAFKYGGGSIAFGTFAGLVAAWAMATGWRRRRARSV
jgi:subtilase family serine protease